MKVLLLCLLLSVALRAADWPAFRGADSTGFAAAPAQPGGALEVAWTIPLPGIGHSTPVIADGRVFVTTAYGNPRGVRIYKTMTWVGALAVIAALLLSAVGTAPAPQKPLGLVLQSANLALLFVLIVAGRELTGCATDPFRTTILGIVVASVALNAVRLLAANSPRASIVVCAAAVVAFACGGAYILNLPVIRRPLILLGASLLPLVVAALAWRDWRSFHSSSPWPTRIAYSIACAPAAAFVGFTFWAESSFFWKIQDTNALAIALPHYAAVGGLLAAGAFLAARATERLKAVGLIWLGWGALFAVPIVTAPFINQFQYARYHLVRGHLGSPLGLDGLAWAAGIFALTSLAPLIGRGRGDMRWAALALPLVAAVASGAGSWLGSAGGMICAVLAFEAPTGKFLWRTEGLRAESKGPINAFNSPATPSPVVVGDIVAAYFGERGAFACRRADGALVWTNNDLPYRSGYGAGSSLAASENTIVLQSDSDGLASYVAGLSIENGRPKWKRDREPSGSWRTPVVFRWQNEMLVCAWGKYDCEFFELKTGAPRGRISEIVISEGDPITSPIIAGADLILTGNDWAVKVPLAQILDREVLLEIPNAPATTNTAPRIIPAWAIPLDDEGPVCGTPAVKGDYLHLSSDGGTLVTVSLGGQKVVSRIDLEATKSSPTIVGNHLFLPTEEGALHVFDVGVGPPKAVKTLKLTGKISSSPAAGGDLLFVRTTSGLVAVRL